MQVIAARNVNDAFTAGLQLLKEEGVDEDSRAGKVRVMPIPVTTLYTRPMERVLFNASRDANPFFHLMESLWMLAGRNDATWLDKFVSDFSSRFAEDTGLQHGAYGFRWREHFGVDQLDKVVDILRKNPGSRQAILTMWDPCVDLGFFKRDLPCNTQVYLRVRKEIEVVGASQVSGLGGAHQEQVSYLDITVCCRSNDIIWGAYGANAVHFSVLQEYLAARIGVGVGRYYQISNNYHAYYDVLPKLIDATKDDRDAYGGWGDPYAASMVKPTPIITDAGRFDQDLETFFQIGTVFDHSGVSYANSFFPQVAVPLFWAYHKWREKTRLTALDRVLGVPEHSDWGLAARDWMGRRIKKLVEKTNGL